MYPTESERRYPSYSDSTASADSGWKPLPWLLVGTMLAGAILVGTGLMAGSTAVIVIGAVLVVVGGTAAIVLPHLGVVTHVSLAENYPAHTKGPRANDTGEPRPPIDTHPNHPYTGDQDESSLPRPLTEVPASELEDPRDPERAKPQHVNLTPHERIRRVAGQDVIEVPDTREDADDR